MLNLIQHPLFQGIAGQARNDGADRAPKSLRDFGAVRIVPLVRRLKPTVNKVPSLQDLVSLTSFSPHLTNKTTSVAEMNANPLRPHYLINTFKNEVMRLITRGGAFSTTEVVQLLKLGGNEVINVNFNKPLFSKSALSNRITTTPLYPYSIILANKGREYTMGTNLITKGAFPNKGLTDKRRRPAMDEMVVEKQFDIKNFFLSLLCFKNKVYLCNSNFSINNFNNINNANDLINEYRVTMTYWKVAIAAWFLYTHNSTGNTLFTCYIHKSKGVNVANAAWKDLLVNVGVEA